MRAVNGLGATAVHWVLLLLCRLGLSFCYAGLCPELLAPVDGGVSWTGLTEGSTALYFCLSGYQLSGDPVRTCERGQWTGTAPTCIRMTMHAPHHLLAL